MCCGCPKAKSFCRIYAFFNLLLGLLSMYYWQYLVGTINKITAKPNWDAIIYLSNATNKTIDDNCGAHYLEFVTPLQFGGYFKNSIKLYVAACLIFSVKGSFQFFVTCFSPFLARSLSLFLVLVDVFTTTMVLYGLYLFRHPNLCLLEYTDVFNAPGQQTNMTIMTFGALAILKYPDTLALLCFIYSQNKLLAKGETRSKGARRSDAFCTPMSSRVNSFIGTVMGKRGRSDKVELYERNSDDDDVDTGESSPFLEDAVNDRIFIEIDLEDDDNDNPQRIILATGSPHNRKSLPPGMV